MTQTTERAAPSADEILDRAVRGSQRVRELALQMMAAGVGRQPAAHRAAYHQALPQTASHGGVINAVPATPHLRVIVGGRR